MLLPLFFVSVLLISPLSASIPPKKFPNKIQRAKLSSLSHGRQRQSPIRCIHNPKPSQPYFVSKIFSRQSKNKGLIVVPRSRAEIGDWTVYFMLGIIVLYAVNEGSRSLLGFRLLEDFLLK